jgi:predicted TIM-barrel fold metal-dependent hydrolase
MLIDCDIHQGNPSHEEWVHFLAEPYKSEVARHGLRQFASGLRVEEGGSRWDARSSSEPIHMIEDLLDRYGHRFALLSGNNGPIAGIPDPDYVAALCRAVNDFNIARWLPADKRFRITLKVALQDPELAVREIERLGDHPGVVAVSFFATANRIAFGERYYWPIYEACQRKALPIHVHPSTTATVANAASTPAGMAQTYLESHVCMPQFYMAQVASLVLSGTFEKFPGLKFLLIEGGFAWLPHLLWRMDAEFKGLRQQAPYLKRMPSDYVKTHVRLGTQPLEEPKRSEHLLQIFDMIDADEILVYASDYPHWDFDEPGKLPRRLSDAARRRILHDNACEFLGLPAPAEPASDEVPMAVAA